MICSGNRNEDRVVEVRRVGKGLEKSLDHWEVGGREQITQTFKRHCKNVTLTLNDMGSLEFDSK